MLSPAHIVHIAHPVVTSAYIKQDLNAETQGKQVLVLETEFDVEHTDNEDKYFDLLVDLTDIKKQAEVQFGDISRVDIKGHTFH